MDAFLSEWRAGAGGRGAKHHLSLATVSRRLFQLLDQLDSGTVPAAFPSLKSLSPVDQRATIAAAANRSTRMKTGTDAGAPSGHHGDDDDDDDDDKVESGSGPTFKVNCAAVRQLAMGRPRTIAGVARAVNVAAGSPVSGEELDAEPFKKPSLTWEVARAYDEGEGLRGHKICKPPSGHGNGGGDDDGHRHGKGDDDDDDGHGKRDDDDDDDGHGARNCAHTQPGTIVANPIKQLFAAFNASSRARFLGTGSLHDKKTWRIFAREQSALDALCYELGSQQIGGEFLPGATNDTLTLALGLCPASAPLPGVKWLNATPQHPATAVPVHRDAFGRCFASLTGVPLAGAGQLVVDLTRPGESRRQLHSVDFAIRNHAPAVMTRHSRDGTLQLFTVPNGASSSVRILFGRTGLPVGDPPPGVTSGLILRTYTVDFMNGSTPFSEWVLNVVVEPNETNLRLFHLPRASSTWQELSVSVLREEPMVRANFVGPGAYLLARRVAP